MTFIQPLWFLASTQPSWCTSKDDSFQQHPNTWYLSGAVWSVSAGQHTVTGWTPSQHGNGSLRLLQGQGARWGWVWDDVYWLQLYFQLSSFFVNLITLNFVISVHGSVLSLASNASSNYSSVSASDIQASCSSVYFRALGVFMSKGVWMLISYFTLRTLCTRTFLPWSVQYIISPFSFCLI